MGRALALGLVSFVLAGCASAPAQDLGDWRIVDLQAGGRVLRAALPFVPAAGGVLTVVIEGDGRAHRFDGSASADPTPGRPVGLSIARVWPRGPTAWLGRLCQGVRRTDPACRPEDWTSHRFSEEAVAAADAALDQLKGRTGARQVVLVGWSGGGVIASLLASRRGDVVRLVTIAAPLDVGAWTKLHRLTPLAGLDPGKLPPPAVAQTHVFGRKDDRVPVEFGSKAARRQGGRVLVLDEAHECCWAEAAARTRGFGGDQP